MSTDEAISRAWEGLVVGEALPTFEYELTSDMIDRYREVVGNPDAAYPTVAARHPAHAFYIRYGESLRLPNMGYECSYRMPPAPGSRISVNSEISGKYIRRNKHYVTVTSTAVDSSGRLIETSRIIGLLAIANTPALAEVGKKWNPKR